MIHEASLTPNASGARKLKAVATNLSMNDARIEVILRDHLRLPEELWSQFGYLGVFLSGEGAVKYGMADEIAEFSPPPRNEHTECTLGSHSNQSNAGLL